MTVASKYSPCEHLIYAKYGYPDNAIFPQKETQVVTALRTLRPCRGRTLIMASFVSDVIRNLSKVIVQLLPFMVLTFI